MNAWNSDLHILSEQSRVNLYDSVFLYVTYRIEDIRTHILLSGRDLVHPHHGVYQIFILYRLLSDIDRVSVELE